jgi:transcriptional regulator with XRE-family HTH domain/Zn-dependent peptidase ImmA (M78 family)
MEPQPLTSWEDVGERVARARRIRGLTQEQLAERSGLERTALSKVESGRRGLSAMELAALATALDRRIDYFVTASPPAVVSHRATSVAPASGAESTIEEEGEALLEELARDLELLIRLGQLDPSERPQPGFAIRDERTAEQAAVETRARLGVPGGPLGDLAPIAERLGLYLFSLPLPEQLDGNYLALERGGVCIVNGTTEPGRRRFTGVHELGHHVLAEAYTTDVHVGAPSDERERLVDIFAAHLLLPRASLHADWRAASGEADPFGTAVDLAARYRASWGAVCNQLRRLGLIDAATKRRLTRSTPTRASFVERGLAVREDLIPPTIPPAVGAAAIRAYREHLITAERAVEMLRGAISLEDLPPPTAVPLSSLAGEFDPMPKDDG